MPIPVKPVVRGITSFADARAAKQAKAAEREALTRKRDLLDQEMSNIEQRQKGVTSYTRFQRAAAAVRAEPRLYARGSGRLYRGAQPGAKEPDQLHPARRSTRGDRENHKGV